MHIGHKEPEILYYMKESDNGQARALMKSDLESDLGVYIASDMNSRWQVNQATSKANSMLDVLKRTFTYRGVGMWKKLYTTYVRPHLELNVLVWCPYLRGDIAKLEAAQRRAAKAAQGMRGKKYDERLRLLDLTSLEDRRVSLRFNSQI